MKRPYHMIQVSSHDRLIEVLNLYQDDKGDYEVVQVLPADDYYRDRIILRERKTKPLTKSFT